MSKSTDLCISFGYTMCDICERSIQAVLFEPVIAGLVRFSLPIALAFAFVSMSWAQADGVIAGSLYYGFGVFNRLRKGRKYGFTYTDAFGEISHPLRVLLTPYIGACVGGLVWMGIESHNASAEQFAINQQVMQTGRGNITCDFGDGKKVVLEQPGKLEEPMRAIVMNGLNAGTCKAQLSISP